MSRFSDLSKDKLTVMERIVSDPDLVKAIYYNDKNFLDQPNLSDDDIATKLAYHHIFPYKRIPGIDEDAKTYVTLSFGRYRQANGVAFKSGQILVNILVHQDNMHTDYGILRSDYIVNKIDGIVSQKRGIGIGKAEFYSMDDVIYNKVYLGNEISYKVIEFS